MRLLLEARRRSVGATRLGEFLKLSNPVKWKSTDTLAVVLIGALFIAAILSFLRVFELIHPDAVGYLDVARSLLEGDGLQHRWAYWDPVYEDGALPTPTSLWPPGFSIVIAGLQMLGIDPILAGRLVSIISALLVPIFIYLILRSHLSVARSVLAAAASSLTLTHLWTSGSVIPEQLFLVLATLAWLATSRAIMSGSVIWWYTASLAAGLSFSVRYVGLAAFCCVPFLALLDGFFAKDRHVPTLLKKLLLVSAPGAMIIGLIFARNYYYTGTVAQPWPGSDIFWSTLMASIQGMVTALVGEREVLEAWNLMLLRPVLLAILAASILGALLNVRRWITQCKPTLCDRSPLLVVHVTALAFIGSYVAIVFLATLRNGMNIEPRYIHLIYPWILAVVFAWLMSPNGRSKVLKLGGPLTCVLFLAGQSLHILNFASEGTYGPFAERTKGAPIIIWLTHNLETEEALLTTKGDEIAFWVPNKMLRLPRLPHSTAPLSWEHVDALADRFGARYLVHSHTAGSAKYDEQQFQFLLALNNPQSFAPRESHIVGEYIIYRVGSHNEPE